MGGPVWAAAALAAVMIATALYCAGRLATARLWRRSTEVEVVPDAEREVQVSVALPRMTRAPTAAAAAAKVARKQKHPDPFKL